MQSGIRLGDSNTSVPLLPLEHPMIILDTRRVIFLIMLGVIAVLVSL
jgi:hypothetical protein